MPDVYGSTKEDAFNHALGGSIEKIRPDWTGHVHVEKSGILEESKGKRVDILIAPDNLHPVPVELVYENTANPDQDAIDRLGHRVMKKQADILTSFVVVIPNSVKNMHGISVIKKWLMQKNKFQYAAYSKDIESLQKYDIRYPEKGYLEGDMWDFSDFVEMSSTPDVSVKKVAKKAAHAVHAIARLLTKHLLPIEQKQIIEKVAQKKTEHAMSVAACIWLNACILHARMAATKNGYNIKGRDIPLKAPWNTKGPSELLNEWKEILNDNHSSVFGPARDSFVTVDKMACQPTARKIFGMLTESVKEACALHTGPVGDIGAQIFPELAAYRKETAAFYTLPEVAELLAGIAVEKFDGEKIRNVGDFASGTGTLLKAAYRTIIRHEKRNQRCPKEQHRKYMEDHLYGADIQPLATHLTSAGLAGIYPDETFSKAKIVCAEISNGRIGSLEMLDNSNLKNLLKYEGDSDFNAPDKSFDLVIMNPPYTVPGHDKSRAFDHNELNDDEREKSKQKMGKLFKKGNIKGNLRAGLGLMFASLADKKLKAKGVFAFVLPMKAASSTSWAGFRKHMTENYEHLVVVSSNQSFSESTSINEILVCGRKREKPVHAAPILMVKLKKNPKDFVEAHNMSQAMRNLGRDDVSGEISIGSVSVGTYHTSQQFSGKPWLVTAEGLEINVIADSLITGTLLYPGMAKQVSIGIVRPLAEHKNFGIGPSQPVIGHIKGDQTIAGAFSFKNAKPEDRTNLALWRADSENQNSLFCQPTHKGLPRTGKEGKADKLLKDTRSTLFISRDLRVTSQALSAAMTKHKCLGGSAWTALICDKEVVPAYWLWLNSIFGLVSRWRCADQNQTGRIRMQINDMKNFSCPVFSAADSRSVSMCKIASKLILNFDGKILKPCSMAWIDNVRHEIDNAVLEMLGVDMSQEELKFFREMWCKESSVHGNKQEIVNRLKSDKILTE